jgi:hypothetical protein
VATVSEDRGSLELGHTGTVESSKSELGDLKLEQAQSSCMLELERGQSSRPETKGR